MRRIFKWAFRLVVLVIVLIVILLLSLDSIIKAVTERRIRAETGMDVKIAHMSVGLLSPVVDIEGLRLYNPAEFGGSPFINIKEIHVEYDRDALSRRLLRVKLMRFDLAEVDIVKNEAGKTNIVELLGPLSASKAPLSNRLPKELRRVYFTGIDVLNLSVGKVRFIDMKEPRANRELNLNVKNQTFKNVRTEEDLQGVLILVWLRSGGGELIGAPGESASSGLMRLFKSSP